MVLDSLGESIRSSIKKLISKVIVDKSVVNEFIKELQRALIVSDVDVKLVFELTKRVKERVLSDKGLARKEQIVRIVYEELVALLGTGSEFSLKKNHKILLVGLFGSGKTTTAGKLALKFKKRGYKPCLLALDTFRAAAVKQLQQLGDKAGVTVFFDEGEKKPERVVKEFSDEFSNYDIIIADSAGRDMLDKSLIKEVKAINKSLRPDDVWLVIPADIGQAARKQAEAFRDALSITGVIITKLDSTARGGGALTACAVAGAPVRFIGVGEGLSDLEEFKPKGFVSRLLGMGDLEALLERAREELNEDSIKEAGERLISGEFSLRDFREQLRAMSKMGSFSKLLSFLPGIGSLKLPVDQLNLQEASIKKFIIIMDSMTPDELDNPKLLNKSRIERIARGSGTSVSDVRALLKQFNLLRSTVKKLRGGNLKKLMKRLGIKDLSALEGLMSN